MNQERRPSIKLAPHEFDALLGIAPIPNEDVFQLIVQELLGGLLIFGVDIHKVGEYAEGLQCSLPALFDRGEETLHRFSCIGAV